MTALQSEANGISGDGSTIVGWTFGMGTHAALWNGNAPAQNLGVFPGTSISKAIAASQNEAT